MELNPYAPPPAKPEDAPTRPSDHGWHVEGRSLFVKAGAVLPMVDLSNGMNEERMAMLRYGVRRRALFPQILLGGGIALVLVWSLLPSSAEIPAIVGELAVLAIVIGLLAPVFLRKIEFHVFVTLETMKRRQRIGWLLMAVQVPLVLLALANISIALPEWVAVVCLILLVILIIGSVTSSFLQRRLKCGRRNGDSFEIRGVHPDALRLLTQIQDRKKVAKS